MAIDGARPAPVRFTLYLPVQLRPMDRTFLLVGAVAGFLGVGLGAFGAHGLRSRVSPEMLAVFETGVRYHMYHALALVATSLLMARMSGWLMTTAGWCFTAGIVLFSGSLYLLAITGVTVLGAITPIGGLAFLAGWACLALAAAAV
jgi:uncharacterized membrane protein YgdD (TMEM256/DUF423 family)